MFGLVAYMLDLCMLGLYDLWIPNRSATLLLLFLLSINLPIILKVNRLFYKMSEIVRNANHYFPDPQSDVSKLLLLSNQQCKT